METFAQNHQTTCDELNQKCTSYESTIEEHKLTNDSLLKENDKLKKSINERESYYTEREEEFNLIKEQHKIGKMEMETFAQNHQTTCDELNQKCTSYKRAIE